MCPYLTVRLDQVITLELVEVSDCSRACQTP
ncbi:unnamed protein product [Timema podura]|uniref:Uncharacterized protein n=1 Tax=Timema podura TaxID=61482 RepID=A0ABN7PEL5_TIMPD|nr:unnamed protein product [Timema podura]